MKRIPRRLFTEEFKREAIKLFTEQHFNVAAAGRQFVLIRNLFALGLQNQKVVNPKRH